MNSLDIMLWPNGDWCYREEFQEYSQNKSDDYSPLFVGTPRYIDFCIAEGIETQ